MNRSDDMEAFRVIVADDDPLARRMIRSALQDAGFVVVAEARNGREAVELTQYYSPDAVLMDVVMPELDGISATRRILSERPDQLVILLTGADEEIGLAGLQAGASGYLNKDVDIEALPRALKGAAAGEAAISRTMGTLLIQQLRRAPTRPTTNGLRPVRSSLTRAGVGGPRPPVRRPQHRPDGHRAVPLDGDRAVPRQEHLPQARRQLARPGGLGGRAPPQLQLIAVRPGS